MPKGQKKKKKSYNNDFKIFLVDRKQRSFDGSEGPMDRYRADYNNNNDVDDEEDGDYGDEEEEEDVNEFIVDDDIIDGVKMDLLNEKVSLPGKVYRICVCRFTKKIFFIVSF